MFIIFGTFLPLTNQMKLQLAEKRVDLHVAITKNQAATSLQNGTTSGFVLLNDVVYFWNWGNSSMCVSYVFFGENRESCDAY